MIYLLEYELKSKHGEDFRKIYKGRAFKCIITDLLANTQYRFRVAPILVKESGIEVREAVRLDPRRVEFESNNHNDQRASENRPVEFALSCDCVVEGWRAGCAL